MRPLVLRELTVSDLRNLTRVALRPSPRVTVVAGSNGHGKTSLLEALYLAATSRSFRTTRLAELTRHGCSRSEVSATFVRDELICSQDVVVEAGRRAVRAEGKRPKSLAAFAMRAPTVCFHAGELELSQGPAAGRRTLLDRVGLFVDPVSADDRARYDDAMRQRKRALDERGVSASELDAFEALAAEHGARLTAARRLTTSALAASTARWFTRIGTPGLTLTATYSPGGTDDRADFARALSARRERDRARGAATFGPHRDDVALCLDGHDARAVASQGQHRALTLSLKLAELDLIADAADARPMFLLDDVSSELDASRTASLFDVLAEREGQLLITTTRPELIDTSRFTERLDLTMRDGRLEG